jgi:cold-inducible RNA-binding protein
MSHGVSRHDAARVGRRVPISFSSEALLGKKLYVGNLAYTITDQMLEEMCAAHGTVQSAQVIIDRDTGRSKGFGFVEMGTDAEAQTVIKEMNLKQVEGRALTVNEAKPKTEGGGRGCSGGGRGGYGGGGGRRW